MRIAYVLQEDEDWEGVFIAPEDDDEDTISIMGPLLDGLDEDELAELEPDERLHCIVAPNGGACYPGVAEWREVGPTTRVLRPTDEAAETLGLDESYTFDFDADALAAAEPHLLRIIADEHG